MNKSLNKSALPLWRGGHWSTGVQRRKELLPGGKQRLFHGEAWLMESRGKARTWGQNFPDGGFSNTDLTRRESVGQAHRTHSNSSMLPYLTCLLGLRWLLIDVFAFSFPRADLSYPCLPALSFQGIVTVMALPLSEAGWGIGKTRRAS